MLNIKKIQDTSSELDIKGQLTAPDLLCIELYGTQAYHCRLNCQITNTIGDTIFTPYVTSQY